MSWREWKRTALSACKQTHSRSWNSGFAVSTTFLLILVSFSAAMILFIPSVPAPDLCSDSCCFLPGTPINLAEGGYKNIEAIKKGDMVKVFNEHSMEVETAPVREIATVVRNDVHKLYLENGKMLLPTGNHPFWTKNKGWATINGVDEVGMGCDELESGDYVYQVNAKNEIEEVKVTRIVPVFGWYLTINFIDMKYGTFIADDIVTHNSADEPIDKVECFVAGTQVLMADGSRKNIEDVRAGDFVKSFDTEKNELVNSKVTLLKSDYHSGKEDDFTIKIRFSDGTISQCTNNHPYYVRGKGWASYRPDVALYKYGFGSEKLAVGDIVYKYNSEGLESVRVITIKEVYERIRTYDLVAVHPNNNFFADGMLVHNSGGCTVTDTTDHKECYGGDVYWYNNCGGRESKYAECGSTSSWSDTGSTRWVATSSYGPTGRTRWVSDGSECGEKSQEEESRDEKEQKEQSRVVRGCSSASCYANTQYQWVDTGSTRTVTRWVDTGETRDVDDYCPSDAYEDSSPLETQWISDGSECGEKEQKRQFLRDHYCSGGSCTSILTETDRWVDTGNTRDNDSNCPADTYVDTGNTRVTTPSISREIRTPRVGVTETVNGSGAAHQKEQDYKDYACSAGSCGHTITDTRWIDTENVVSYEYKFYNLNDSAIRQDWSTDESYTLQSEDAHDTMRYYVRASYGGTTSEESSIDVPVENSPPAASFDHSKPVDPTADAIVINNSEYVNFSDTSSDPDRDSLTRTWKIFNTDGSVLLRTYNNAAENLNYTFNVSGTFRVLLHVDDGYTGGALDTNDVTIKVKQKIRKVPAPGKNIVRIPWMNGETTTADLISQFNLRTNDTIKIQNRTTGLFNVTVNTVSDTSAYIIKPGDVVMVVLNNETSKTEGIDVTLDPSIDRATSINTTIITENAPGVVTLGGYNYLTWLPENSTTASDFASELNLQTNQLIAKYNDDTGSYDTAYIVGLPFTDFTIRPGDMICIKAKFADADTMKEASMTYTDTTIKTTS